MKTGFDNDKYLTIQSEHIKERIGRFGGKLYLEFGGKLFDDYHASRVLPGFMPDSKIRMLLQMRDDVEAIVAVNSADIERNKVRGDLGITYDLEVLRLIDQFTERGIPVAGVVLTRYTSQPAAVAFEERLKTLGIKSYRHYPIAGYPSDIDRIVSDDGFGKNEFVPTTKPLVVVTAPGPGSGKMAVALSQMYGEFRRGKKAGYAKFETFPIWNIPLRHPVNIAYEAATIDLGDVNMIDPFHMEAYGKSTVNYNRDIEVFPILNAMLEMISGTSIYKSPTDMGVNMAGYCIFDDEAVSKASTMETIRRYFKCLCDNKQGLIPDETVHKFDILLRNASIDPMSRKVIPAVRELASKTDVAVIGIELEDGTIVTGKESPLLTASSAMILNSLKVLSGIDDGVFLISPDVLNPVKSLKVHYLGKEDAALHANEMLVALAISAKTDSSAEKALSKLPMLSGCEVHSSFILSPTDAELLKNLNMNVTCEPKYQKDNLYHGGN